MDSLEVEYSATRTLALTVRTTHLRATIDMFRMPALVLLIRSRYLAKSAVPAQLLKQTPRDLNTLAKNITYLATGQAEPTKTYEGKDRRRA